MPSVIAAANRDSLGFLMNTDGSNAHRNFEQYLTILEQTLTGLGMMPKRNFKDIEEFESYMKTHSTLIIDVSEQATQRPKDNQQQQEMYSGKKKKHTHKELIISDITKKVLYISNTYKGKVHDYNLLQKEFPPEIKWFEKFNIRLDLGGGDLSLSRLC